MTPPDAVKQQAKREESGQKHRTDLVTLLFTDMVGSTALKQQLGDRAGAAFFDRHHRIVREILARFQQGQEIAVEETAGAETKTKFERRE